MKKLLFTILCLFGLQISGFSQKPATSTEEDSYYVYCRCESSSPETVFLFKFRMKASKSSNIISAGEKRSFHQLLPKVGENINGIADVFDEEYGFDKIDKTSKVIDRDCAKEITEKDFQSYWGAAMIVYYDNAYFITWQPPAKYTGIEPIDTTPIIVPGKRNTNNTRPTPSKPSQGYITVEKKDTKFQEAEAKRILEAKKAEVQREIRLQAIKNKAEAEDKERIRLLLEAQKKRGNKQ